MPSLLTTALVGFFLLSGTGAADQISQGTGQTKSTETYTVSMTAYNAVEAQTDEDPFTTASGAFSDPNIVLARSSDLAEKLPFGTVVELVAPATADNACGFAATEHLIGYRVVADAMHPRKRNQVDILFPTEATVPIGGKRLSAARAFGICEGVQVRVIGRVDPKNMPTSQTEIVRAIGKAQFALK